MGGDVVIGFEEGLAARFMVDGINSGASWIRFSFGKGGSVGDVDILVAFFCEGSLFGRSESGGFGGV